MANSKRKVILEYIKDTTLAAITVAGGYNHDIGTIERGIRNLDNVTDDEFPVLFMPGASEARKDRTKIHFESSMSVLIVGYVKDTDGVEGGIQVQLDDLIEDVTKAMYADEGLGGNALELAVIAVDPDDGDQQSHAGFVMQVDVRYSTLKATP